MRTPSGLHIDSPSWPLLQAVVSYWGITSAAGNAGGTTLVDANLANEPSYDGLTLKILSGPAAGQARTIQTHVTTTLTVGVGFTNAAGAAQQITAGVLYCILSALGGGGGPGPAPAEGLSYYGIVDAVPGANQFTISGLAGLGAGKFAGATNPYSAFVLRDAGGASAAPQGEAQAITAYVTATGVFTTVAFTAAAAAGDEILIVSPMLANVLVILAGLAVPPVDSAVNLLMRDVTGNKADTALYAATLTDSLMRYLKAVLHTEVLAIGTFTASSATVPADAARTEANDAWKGCLLMPLVAGAGLTAFQPKRIESFANAGGVFTIDPGNPFTAATGLVAYAILPAQADFVPAVDSALNVSTAEVAGNKADTIPDMNLAPAATDSIIRHIKAILERVGATPADPDDSLLTSVGQRDATATLDTLGDITTTDLQAKIRRALMRLSPDAFTATVQGNADTALDTMVSDLATYFVAAGAAMALQVNGNAARTNLQQALSDFFAAFGCDGVNVFNPTVQGAARTDLDAALAAMATYFSAGGAAWSVQINGNAARTNLEQVWEDFSAVFGADGVNVFNPTIQGAAQTNLDAALAQLAIYFAAAGAAMSIQVQGGAARANLELVLEDYFAVVGCDGVNLFNPTIQGAARTTFDAAFAALATYISPAGVAYSATVNPGAVAKTTIEETLEDLGDVLASAGITTYPAGAVPANGVSIAAALRQVYLDQVVPGADAVANAYHRDVVGNKADTAIYTKDVVSSLIRYLKGLLDATITAWGTADAGSGVGQVRDAARTEADDWWNGQTVLMLTGAAAFQKRPISDFVAATDDILVAPNFDAAVAAGDIYVILAHYNQIVPRTADSVANALASDVIGRKDDTVDYTPGATTSSLIRLLKGVLGAAVVAEGTFTTSSATVPADTGRTEATDWFKGHILMPVAGAAAFQPRPVGRFTSGTDVFTLDEPFTAAPGLVAYVILASDYPVQRMDDLQQSINGQPVLLQATFTGNLSNGGTATICTLDALGDAMRNILIKVFISGAVAGAGITPAWYVTRYSAPVTFTQQTVPSLGAQHAPAAAVVEDYEVSDLPEGLQGELRIASAGNDSALTFEATVTYEQ